jgi:hypothetical protein
MVRRAFPTGQRAARGGGGELRDRLGTRVASGNGPREGARGSDAEAAGGGARRRGQAHWSARDVAPAWKCFGLALFKRGFRGDDPG